MSTNKIYDVIEDAVIGTLEEETVLPSDFSVTLEPSQLKALIEAGLSADFGKGERVSIDATAVYVTIQGHNILVKSTEHKELALPS